MASEIRVNTINNRSGLGTISITNSGAVFSGVTTFAQIKTTSGEVTVGTGASVFSPATNVLALGTNSVERVRITSTGSVGIGTDTITGKVQIDTTSGGRALTVNAPTNGTYITFETNDTPYADIGSEAGTVGSGTNDLLVLNARSTRDLAFRTNSAERLRITSSGNIGIGTNNPGRLFQVFNASTNPQVNIKAASGGTCELQFGDTADEVRGNIVYNCTDDYLSLHGYNNAERLRITSAGNVGIKVTEPDLTLHVNGTNALPSSSGSTPTGHLTLRNKQGLSSHGMFMGVSNASPWSSWIQAQDASNNATNYPLLLNPNGGNIGIGIDNPASLLHLQGSAPRITFTDTAGTDDIGKIFSSSGALYIQQRDGSAHGEIIFRTENNSTAVERLRINTNGDIEVGSYTNSGNIVLFKTGDNNTTRINFYDNNNTEGCYLKAQGITNGGIFRMGNRWNTDSDKISFNMVDGTIGVPNGGGISFAATSDAAGMTSELLDDYEEGSWTPAFVNAGTMTYAIQVGRYTKIGNLVHATCHLDVGSKGTASGEIRISGLPFTSINVTNYHAVSSTVHGTDWTTARRSINVLLSTNTTTTNSIYHNMTATTFSSNPSITGSDWGHPSHDDLGTGNLLFSITYQAA